MIPQQIDNASAAEDTMGGRISMSREIADLSIEKAAARLGVLPETWMAWECDRDVPRSNRVAMMAGVLGVAPSWLLCGHGTGPAAQAEPGDADASALVDAVREVSGVLAELNKRVEALSRSLQRDDAEPASG